MASVISKKPFVGFAAAVLFGFLGMLLIRIDGAPGAPRGITLWLFRIAGYFLLFVALSSAVTAVYALRRNGAGRSKE